ncbi:rod shape-determining protein [Pelomonas cellulosilytica]|uniref:Rod shape-determining protein n=1 Tax=Pelomonas cellulosilytica TaxID=2906762 RepID=A0ABS8XV62_9BURK|nr:rod shape-determining protein [Pelomonas sp. P8]MCE4554609.1 rod shape-determining protein [Pelomonas sp. P8]
MLRDFFNQRLYIQLSPQRVKVRDPRSGREVDEVPEIAVQRPPTGKASVLAVGSQARSATAQAGATLHNPFAHPRSLVSDFTLADQVLKAFARRVVGGGMRFVPNPIVIVHPLGEHAGGLTQVEIRALRELALGLGASGAKVWQGPPLTDKQLLSGELPGTGSVLDA